MPRHWGRGVVTGKMQGDSVPLPSRAGSTLSPHPGPVPEENFQPPTHRPKESTATLWRRLRKETEVGRTDQSFHRFPNTGQACSGESHPPDKWSGPPGGACTASTCRKPPRGARGCFIIPIVTTTLLDEPKRNPFSPSTNSRRKECSVVHGGLSRATIDRALQPSAHPNIPGWIVPPGYGGEVPDFTCTGVVPHGGGR